MCGKSEELYSGRKFCAFEVGANSVPSSRNIRVGEKRKVISLKKTAIESPEWLTHGAVYQINPRTFSKDGTIGAVTEELDFLKSIGFDIIYLCPFFCEDESETGMSPRQIKSGTGNPKNPYRMNDYFAVDSEYGTSEDLAELISEAHKRGMRLLLDLVYAHIGPNAPIIKRYPDFVHRTADGEIINTEWNFPALDFRCEGLREYLYCNMIYYISVIDADGFRCDVGDAVPDDFWYEARKRMKKIKPDSVLINEGSKYERMMTSFNATYFFNWHETLYKVFCRGESAETIPETDKEAKRGNFPKGGMLLRDIDNHDTVTDWSRRTETAAGHDGMEQIEVINYLADGIPMVYCGNEIACEANLNLFANRFYPGGFEVTDRKRKDTPAAMRRMNILKQLNKLKRQSDILADGEMKWCECTNNSLSFRRTLDERGIIFVGNTGNSVSRVTVGDVPKNAGIILSNGVKEYRDGCFNFERYGYAVLEY